MWPWEPLPCHPGPRAAPLRRGGTMAAQTVLYAGWGSASAPSTVKSELLQSSATSGARARPRIEAEPKHAQVRLPASPTRRAGCCAPRSRPLERANLARARLSIPTRRSKHRNQISSLPSGTQTFTQLSWGAYTPSKASARGSAPPCRAQSWGPCWGPVTFGSIGRVPGPWALLRA